MRDAILSWGCESQVKTLVSHPKKKRMEEPKMIGARKRRSDLVRPGMMYADTS